MQSTVGAQLRATSTEPTILLSNSLPRSVMSIQMIAAGLAFVVASAGLAHGDTLLTPDPGWHGVKPNVSSLPTQAVFGNGWIFYAAGNYVYGRYASTGQQIAAPLPTGGNIENAPALAQLRDGRWYVFVASGDGKLYKLDVQNSISLGSMQIARFNG